MKHCLSSILLLLMTYHSAAWTAQSQDRSKNNEQEHTLYQGRAITSLQFRGNKHFSSEALLEFMRTKEGDPYDTERIDSDRAFARELVLCRNGYLKAHIGKPQIEETTAGLEIVVPVEEGALYRFGTISIKGPTVFSPEEATKIVGLTLGEIADSNAIRQGLSELERLYKNRGYFMFDAEIELDFKITNADEGVLNFGLSVDEGRVFRVNAISFTGNTRIRGTTLRRLLLVNDGDLYNESLLREGLRRLNNLGVFEEVKFEDASFHINDDGKLDIAVRVSEKDQ